MLLEMTLSLRKRGTCRRGTTGAIIAHNGRPISTGYNGPTGGSPHCSDRYCDISQPCKRSVHAEANAIVFAARHGIATEGCTLYTTIAPCYNCAQLIVNAGISKVIYLERYRDRDGLILLKKSQISHSRISLEVLDEK